MWSKLVVSSLQPSKIERLSGKEVIRLASHLDKYELELQNSIQVRDFVELNITLLASLSSQHFESILRVFLLAEKISPNFTSSDYDGILNGGRNPESPVWTLPTDALVILPSLDDIKVWPGYSQSAQEVEDWAAQIARPYIEVWGLSEGSFPSARIYQFLFPLPLERELGNLEHRIPSSRSNCVKALNDYLTRAGAGRVTTFDLDAVSAEVGRLQWYDEVSYFAYRQPFSIRHLPRTVKQFARVFSASFGKIRKCLVVDLDNTLWGGVAGDDGLSGIIIGPGDPRGEAFLAFQNYLLRLKERGILLAVCSKNNAETAEEVFRGRPEMALSLEDFVAFHANWDEKVDNIRNIAASLNIGLDSIVFFDDNPSERRIVAEYLPDVLVVEVPADPAMYVRALGSSFAFEWPSVSEEDGTRTQTYRANIMRGELEGNEADYSGYLKSLKMQLTISEAQDVDFDRVTQLFAKTNQFNFSGKRYSTKELHSIDESTNRYCYCFRLRDAFSDFGIIAVAVIQTNRSSADLHNVVLSCRVFGRGIEDAIFDFVEDFARSRGSSRLEAVVSFTKRNRDLVSGFLDRRCFEPAGPATMKSPRSLLDEGLRYMKDLSVPREPTHQVERFFVGGTAP